MHHIGCVCVCASVNNKIEKLVCDSLRFSKGGESSRRCDINLKIFEIENVEIREKLQVSRRNEWQSQNRTRFEGTFWLRSQQRHNRTDSNEVGGEFGAPSGLRGGPNSAGASPRTTCANRGDVTSAIATDHRERAGTHGMLWSGYGRGGRRRSRIAKNGSVNGNRGNLATSLVTGCGCSSSRLSGFSRRGSSTRRGSSAAACFFACLLRLRSFFAKKSSRSAIAYVPVSRRAERAETMPPTWRRPKHGSHATIVGGHVRRLPSTSFSCRRLVCKFLFWTIFSDKFPIRIHIFDDSNFSFA